MPHVISLRDVPVLSTLGHCAQVTARVPKEIPQALVPAALALGCVLCGPKGEALGDPVTQLLSAAPPVPAAPPAPPASDDEDDEDPELPANPAPPPPAPPANPPTAPSNTDPPADTAVRREAIATAIAQLIAENDVTKFRKDGTPRQAAINCAAGFAVDALELLQVLAEVKTTE